MQGRFALGIDIGGTQIRAALVDEHGLVVKRGSVSTNGPGGPDVIVQQAVQIAREVGANVTPDQIAAIGVCAPGPLDSDTGDRPRHCNIAGLAELSASQQFERCFRTPGDA